MKIAYLALAASAVLASPIEPVVDAKKPADVCHAAPYKQWLALSSLPAATSYCENTFPQKAAKKCGATTITPKAATAFRTVTQTNTIIDASIATVTTGQPTVITVTETANPPITFISSTATAPAMTITGCSTASASSQSSMSASSNSSMSDFGNSTAAINRRQLAKSPVDLAAKKKATKTKLSPKAKKSLQAKLKSLKSLKKEAKATTICHCIETAPACVKKTITASRSTVTEIVYATVPATSMPVTTITVQNTQTSTNISTVPATTTATVFLNAGTITPTAYVGCNATSTGSA